MADPGAYTKEEHATLYSQIVSNLERAIRVGDGRGFVVDTAEDEFYIKLRYVITAAHCLPRLPPKKGPPK